MYMAPNQDHPYFEFVDGVLADDVLEVDDVLVLEPRQHLHLAQRPLTERLRHARETDRGGRQIWVHFPPKCRHHSSF